MAIDRALFMLYRQKHKGEQRIYTNLTISLDMNLISNKDIFNYNIYKNTYNFDNEVVNILQKKGFVRRRELITHLKEKHQEERGYSKTNLNKKIDSMAKRGIITVIKYEDLDKFGIEETDGRASYISLKQASDIKAHLDEIFRLFENGDISDKNLVISEIFSYEDVYVLDPSQLDVLVENLDEDDLNLLFNILVLLYRHVIERGIKPSEEKTYLDSLKKLLEKYPMSPREKTTLRGFIISLLGVYNDKAVVDQLIKDAENMEDLSSVEGEYEKIFTARVIENHRTELFELERTLNKQGKTKNTITLHRIKHRARVNLGIAPQDSGIKFPGVD